MFFTGSVSAATAGDTSSANAPGMAVNAASAPLTAATERRRGKRRVFLIIGKSRSSALEPRARRVVGSVNHGVAAQAVAAVHLGPRRLIAGGKQAIDGGRRPVGQIGAAVDRTGVIGAVAVLAQPRRALLEQRGIGGAVRGMAVGAVVGDRAVLPQERAATVGVAGVAGVVDR